MSKETDPIALNRPVSNDYGNQDWFDDGVAAARQSLLAELRPLVEEFAKLSDSSRKYAETNQSARNDVLADRQFVMANVWSEAKVRLEAKLQQIEGGGE